jgi:RNA polymerase sigma-70 factor (ECF subfamily)
MQCLANNRMAQEKLYRSQFNLFYIIAKKYSSDKEIILSMINEAFLKIFINLQKFDYEKGTFQIWAKKILHNVCIDFYRKTKAKLSFTDIPDEALADYFHEQSPSFSVDINKYFSRLTPTTQKICRMYLIEGHSLKEIAQMMNINENTCRWHMAEGKKKLKEWLKDYND